MESRKSEPRVKSTRKTISTAKGRKLDFTKTDPRPAPCRYYLRNRCSPIKDRKKTPPRWISPILNIRDHVQDQYESEEEDEQVVQESKSKSPLPFLVQVGGVWPGSSYYGINKKREAAAGTRSLGSLGMIGRKLSKEKKLKPESWRSRPLPKTVMSYDEALKVAASKLPSVLPCPFKDQIQQSHHLYKSQEHYSIENTDQGVQGAEGTQAVDIGPVPDRVIEENVPFPQPRPVIIIEPRLSDIVESLIMTGIMTIGILVVLVGMLFAVLDIDSA